MPDSSSPLAKTADRVRRIRRRLFEAAGSPRYTPRTALSDLDRKLEPYLGFRRGFFIEAGAGNGWRQSNTYYLEHGRGWSGLLVEPIPENANICRQIRPRSVVRNVALVAPDFGKPTTRVSYAYLMSVVEDAMPEEQRRAHVAHGVDVQRLPGTYEVDVPVATLTALLDELRPPRIDFFSLDVEHYELQVLRGLDLERYRPVYILVEANDRPGVTGHLEASSYRCVAELTKNDLLYRDGRLPDRR